MNGIKRPSVLAAAALLGLPMLLIAGPGSSGNITGDRAQGSKNEGAGCMVPPDPSTAAESPDAVLHAELSRGESPAIDRRAPTETELATFAMG